MREARGNKEVIGNEVGRKEVKYALKKMKGGKAASLHGTLEGMLKCSSVSVMD